MSIILSLQGSMAVGKTSAAQYIEKKLPEVFVSYENPYPMIAEIKKRKLDMYILEDFIEIQRLFINAELKRWKTFEKYPIVLTDLGAEEIEFYTLFFPHANGLDWNTEECLKHELTSLRCCKSNEILFMDATKDTLIKHKENDRTRKRGSFDFYINNMLEHKRKWLAEKKETMFINVDGLTVQQVGKLVLKWVNCYLP